MLLFVKTTIEKIQILSVQLSPLLFSFKRHGAVGISRAVVPSLAIGLITSVSFIEFHMK